MLLSRTPSQVPPRVPTAAPNEKTTRKHDLIELLIANEISAAELHELKGLDVTADDLSNIIQRIYDLNEKYILELSAVDSLLRQLDDNKNARRNKRFKRKMKRGFRNTTEYPNRKVILAEGDSWFNYPVILTDIIDRISMEKNFAVYSLASGGDWLLNMLTARHYVEQMSVIHPDVFIISAGGNDLVGSSRLSAMVDPSGASTQYQANEWARQLIHPYDKKKTVPFDEKRFLEGTQYLSKDFFALLMFFDLQYNFLIKHILNNAAKPGDKFFGIKIITQGYDAPVPSIAKSFGLNPFKWYVPFIRIFLGHGGWLKIPLQTRGINDASVQKNILYAMMWLFNEMMIQTGAGFNVMWPDAVVHIDSRDTVGDDGWTDELHAKPVHFLNTGKVFVDVINGEAISTYGHVYEVKEILQRNKKS